MKVRGRRECQACGTVWSYSETGSPACPNCGSLRSVGIDDRTHHTDDPVTLDLSPVRNRIDDLPREEFTEQVAETAREYVRRRGFIDAGAVRPLDHTYVAASELHFVADAYGRLLQPSDDAERYFLDLLQTAADGEPRTPESVPEPFRSPYGLALASAVGDFLGDLRTHLREVEDAEARPVRTLAGRIRDNQKRIEALDGAVDPADARRLVRASRDLGRAVADDDESALVTADNWLSGIEGD